MRHEHNQRDCERRDWWQHLRDDEYPRIYYIDWFGWV